MNTIKRDVYVLRNTIKIPIEVTKGTNAITFEFAVRDYNLPVTAAAVAYAYRGGMKKPNSTLCNVEDNVISFQPSANFFEAGNNELQIRVINEDKSLISFKERVKCSDAMGFLDDDAENQKTLVEQILAKTGQEAGERKTADEKEKQERIEAINTEKAGRIAGDAREKSERQAEIATERARINQFTKLAVGSTTGDAELIDGRMDVDGEVHDNIGDAMRGQVRKLRENLVVRQKEQPTDPNNNVWISDEDDEVEVPDMREFNSLKEDIGDLKNILDEFPINFTRGYHVTYVSNGVTKVKESSDTAGSAYQQRVKSHGYDKGVIPFGSSIVCKGLATARVWFVTYENVLIGYTEFVKEYTIPETYNASSYERIYIDAKNSDSSVMETNYAKKNIRVVGRKNIQDRLANVEEETEKAIKYITPSKKRCWTIHNQKDMYVLENGDKTPVKAYLDKKTTPSGTMYVNNGRTVYRNAVTSPLFEKLTWLVSIGTVGDFAFGTKDVNGGGNGVKCVISPSNKTIKIYHSDWDGTDNIKRNLTFDFVISANEKYLLEISKDGLYSISFCFSCITDTAKTFKYEHIADNAQLKNKIRAWGGVAFQSLGGQFRLWEMSQKTLVDEYFNLLLIGDSFIEVASTLIPSNAGFAYLVRKELGTKCSASGRGGATTSELLQRIKTDGDVGKYKFVFLQIGANDSISETITVDIFKKNLLNIIDYFIERGVEPVLTTIPIRTDSDNTNFITKVNPWIKSLGYKFVDEYNIVRGENVLSDGIHLSKNGNTCIFNSIKGVIPEVFS